MIREHQSQSCMIYISAILTHELVCVPLALAKRAAIMNSPSKAAFIVTEDIDHVQNVPDPVSKSVSASMDMHWYGVWISQLVAYERPTRVHSVRQEVIWRH